MAEWAWSSEDWRDWEWHGQYAYRAFKRYVPPGSRVLEVGFGSGRMISRMARDPGCRAFGVDVEDSAFSSLMESCRFYGTRVGAVKGSTFELPFSNGSFDLVYSEGVIEHFPGEDIIRSVSEHIRVCKKGGLVIISVPNRYAYFHTLAKRVAGPEYQHYPEKSFSRHELVRLLSDSGLRIVGLDGFGFGCQFVNFKVYVLNKYLHWRLKGLPWRALRLLKRLHLYDWGGPKLRSIFGFQVMAVGRKERQ